ncbi:putative E3 ubiquitin-protein ligase DTX3 [Glandiceps talaboti]
MFDGVYAYTQGQSRHDTLQDICFIDIDISTVAAFSDVFEKKLSLFSMPYSKGAIMAATQTQSQLSGKIPPGYGRNDALDSNPSKAASSQVPVTRRKSCQNTPDSTAGSTTWEDKESHDHSKTLAADTQCTICMDDLDNPRTLPCGHKFCTDCIDQAEKHQGPICPVCKQAFGLITGNMPYGTMKCYKDENLHLPGYDKYDAIVICYNFPSGIQEEVHPNPGKSFTGTSRTAYLPDNGEGRQVLRLLKTAFERKLTFTIGTSVTTGLTDTVTWNDIHHKTNIRGGAQGFGYPDSNYLTRVKDELAAKGVEMSQTRTKKN